MSDPKFPVERADLTRLPFRALAVVAKVIESGDRKYQAGDWIMAPQRVDGRRDLNSALRHIAEYVEGKDVDEDSGESPLAHAAARLLFLLEREARGIKGGGWRIGRGPLAADDPGSPDFRLPLTPRVCGAGAQRWDGHVALCGLDEDHTGRHVFTVPDITDERPKSPSGEAWDPIADLGEIAREINRTPLAEAENWMVLLRREIDEYKALHFEQKRRAERAERLAVFAVREGFSVVSTRAKGVCAIVSNGARSIECDGSPAGIIAALDKAAEGVKR